MKNSIYSLIFENIFEIYVLNLNKKRIITININNNNNNNEYFASIFRFQYFSKICIYKIKIRN